MRVPVLSILAAGSLLSSAAAELTYTATVVQDGKQLDPSSALKFLTVPPRSHLPSHNATGASLISKRNTASDDWCGVTQKARGGDSISNIFGYFTVPDLTLRKGHDAPQFASAWVGIDGWTCKSALLQAGISTQVNADGSQVTAASFEWYPDRAYSIEGFPGKSSTASAAAAAAAAGRFLFLLVLLPLSHSSTR